MAPSLSGGPIIAAVRVLAWIELAAALIVGGVGVYQWAVLSPNTQQALEESRAQRNEYDDRTRDAALARIATRASSSLAPREWLSLGVWSLAGGVVSALLLLLVASMAENLAVMRFESER